MFRASPSGSTPRGWRRSIRSPASVIATAIICFHLVVGGLQDIGGPLRRADVGAEMNPRFRFRHEARPTLDEAIEAEVTELMAA